MTGTPLEEEVQEGPEMGQLGAQEQVPRGHRAQGPLVTLEEFGPLVLVLGSSQDLGGNFQLQMDPSSFDLLLGIVESIEHNMKEQGESSNIMEIKTHDLEPKPMCFTS